MRKVPEVSSTKGGDDIAQAMERATAATSADPIIELTPEEDAQTVAEPEMEIDNNDLMGEEEELEQEPGDPDEHADQTELDERRPVLVSVNTRIIDPELAQAKLSKQVPYHSNNGDACCIDSILPAGSYMAYIVICCMYKNWRGNMRWLGFSYPQMQEHFQQGMRYQCGNVLSEVDPVRQCSI